MIYPDGSGQNGLKITGKNALRLFSLIAAILFMYSAVLGKFRR